MQNYPKIIFKYSWIYDENWKEWIRFYKKDSKKYPSVKEIQNYLKKVKKLWQKDKRRVLTELSRISHLNWKDKSIYCYIVGRCRPFSDPLTLPVYKNRPDYFIDILTHELIHRLFTQENNLLKSEKAWKYIDNKYKKESRIIRIHIPLYAIHSHIYLKFYGEKRLKRDFDLIKVLPHYKKAWEIVYKDGYKNIITEFTKRIKV